MPAGKHRSRSMRRVFRKTPGSRTVKHFKRRKPAPSQCSMCGRNLAGVPRATKAELANMPKTKKRPERPFGGVLCSSCSRQVIKSEIKNQ